MISPLVGRIPFAFMETVRLFSCFRSDMFVSKERITQLSREPLLVAVQTSFTPSVVFLSFHLFLRHIARKLLLDISHLEKLQKEKREKEGKRKGKHARALEVVLPVHFA